MSGHFTKHYYCRACDTRADDEPICYFCGEPAEKVASVAFLSGAAQGPRYDTPPP